MSLRYHSFLYFYVLFNDYFFTHEKRHQLTHRFALFPEPKHALSTKPAENCCN